MTGSSERFTSITSDATLKRFGVSQKAATFGIDAVRREACKCVVLCASCHAEVEHGGASLALK